LPQEHNVRHSTVQQWIAQYQSMGESGLITSSKNASYSEELKMLMSGNIFQALLRNQIYARNTESVQ
jgi:hypothetical protein